MSIYDVGTEGVRRPVILFGGSLDESTYFQLNYNKGSGFAKNPLYLHLL